MGTNKTYPRSQKQDERVIIRKYDTFDRGMISDTPASELPVGSVAELDNARAFGNSIRGRKGTSLWYNHYLPRIADGLVVNISGNVITLEDNLGNDADVIDPAYIHYKIGGERQDGSRVVLFIENVIDAHTATVSGNYEEGDTVYTDGYIRAPIKASYADKSTGIEYYLIGTKIYAHSSNGTVGSLSTFVEYFVHGQAPSPTISTFHKINGTIVLVNSNGIYVLSQYDRSTEIEIDPYAFVANGTIPEEKISRSPTRSTYSRSANNSPEYPDPSAYNYAYCYSKIRDFYNLTRLDDGSYIEFETPPYRPVVDDADRVTNNTHVPKYLPDGNNKCYTTIHTALPVCESKFVTLWFQGTYSNVNNLVALSVDDKRPYLTMTVNGDTFKVYIDFTRCETFKDVGVAVDKAVKQASNTLNAKVYASDTFSLVAVWSSNKDTAITFTEDTSDVDGYSLTYHDILGTVTNKTSDLGCTVQMLRYPDSRNDVTHYSVYRSKDCLPIIDQTNKLTDPRIANDPNKLAWINDIPVCKVIKVTKSGTGDTGDPIKFVSEDVCYDDIYSPIYKINSGSTNNVISESDTTYYFDEMVDDGTGEISWNDANNGGMNSSTEAYYVLGAKRVIKSAKSGNRLTQTGVFTASDIGKIIFWHDNEGRYSVISDFDGTYAYTLDHQSFDSKFGAIEPTYRAYYDRVPDSRQAGYSQVYPLKTMFYDRMQTGTISAYNGGQLFTAIAGEPTIYHSDTADMYLIGYNHSTAQINNKIDLGIMSMFPVNDFVAVMTNGNTYSIPVQQSKNIANEYGESYTVIRDPQLVHRNIGATHSKKYANAENGDVIVVTNEPAIRMFNGVSFGDNIADGSIQTTHLQQLSTSMVVDYDKISGIHLWGKRASNNADI